MHKVKVEYKGDGSDLIPEDDEIDDVQFFRKDEVSELLFPESRDFFEKHIQNNLLFSSNDPVEK